MKIGIEQIIRDNLSFTEAEKFIKVINENDLNCELEKLTINLFAITEENAKEEMENKLEESQDKLIKAIEIIKEALLVESQDKLFKAIEIIEEALEQIENL